MTVITLFILMLVSSGLGSTQQYKNVGQATGCECTTTTRPHGEGECSCIRPPGRPGKRGPKGSKGDKGEPCECNEQTIRQMQSQIDRLIDDLGVYWKLSNSFPSSCAEYMQYEDGNRKFERVPLFTGKANGNMVPVMVNCTELEERRGLKVIATEEITTTQTTTLATTTSPTPISDKKTHILLGQRTKLSLLTMNASSFLSLVPYPVDVGNLVAIDYDPITDYIFWTGNGVIKRAKAFDSEPRTIISGLSSQVDGIAVDWVAGNLYWTDKVRQMVEVSRLSGTPRKALITTDIEYPRAIVLDPAKGKMYWSDWGSTPKIEGTSLDGNDRRVLVKGSMMWPNGMALDYERNVLYWVDSFLDKIEAVNLDDLVRIVLAQFSQHIFGFTYLNDFIYWTDWQSGGIERLSVFNTSFRHSIAKGGQMMGIKAYDDTPRTETNGCSVANGGCSDFCLYTPAGVKCSCRDNYRLLADRKTCRAM